MLITLPGKSIEIKHPQSQLFGMFIYETIGSVKINANAIKMVAFGANKTKEVK